MASAAAIESEAGESKASESNAGASGAGRGGARLRPVVRPLSAQFDAAAWDALAACAVEPNPFFERPFLESSRGLAGAARVRVVEVWDGPDLIAAVPIAGAARYARMPVAHTESWLHFHAFAGAPLLARGREAEAAGALIDAIDAMPARGRLLHLTGIWEDGPAHRALAAAAAARGRPCEVVHRTERALLASPLPATDYYENAVRKKKRKELKRLENRLAEMGRVETARFAPGDDLSQWIDAYLRLEATGWKGREGSALAAEPATARFFADALAGARAAGTLDMIRMTLDGRTIAILVNFLRPPGGYAFKTAFDEDLARYSPGVLLQIANLSLLDRGDLAWVDSCAVADHSMINGIWRERRAIVRLTLPLSGPVSAATFTLLRTLERAAAAARRRTATTPTPEPTDD